MLSTVTGLLILAALVCSIAALAGKAPVGVAPLLLALVHVLAYLPLH